MENQTNKHTTGRFAPEMENQTNKHTTGRFAPEMEYQTNKPTTDRFAPESTTIYEPVEGSDLDIVGGRESRGSSVSSDQFDNTDDFYSHVAMVVNFMKTNVENSFSQLKKLKESDELRAQLQACSYSTELPIFVTDAVLDAAYEIFFAQDFDSHVAMVVNFLNGITSHNFNQLKQMKESGELRAQVKVRSRTPQLLPFFVTDPVVDAAYEIFFAQVDEHTQTIIDATSLSKPEAQALLNEHDQNVEAALESFFGEALSQSPVPDSTNIQVVPQNRPFSLLEEVGPVVMTAAQQKINDELEDKVPPTYGTNEVEITFETRPFGFQVALDKMQGFPVVSGVRTEEAYEKGIREGWLMTKIGENPVRGVQSRKEIMGLLKTTPLPAVICFQKKSLDFEKLQGYWTTSHGEHLTVDRNHVTFAESGNTYEIKLVDGYFSLLGFRLKDDSDDYVWEKENATPVSWTRVMREAPVPEEPSPATLGVFCTKRYVYVRDNYGCEVGELPEGSFVQVSACTEDFEAIQIKLPMEGWIYRSDHTASWFGGPVQSWDEILLPKKDLQKPTTSEKLSFEEDDWLIIHGLEDEKSKAYNGQLCKFKGRSKQYVDEVVIELENGELFVLHEKFLQSAPVTARGTGSMDRAPQQTVVLKVPCNRPNCQNCQSWNQGAFTLPNYVVDAETAPRVFKIMFMPRD